MPAVRMNGFLASTAVALLLSVGGAIAQPATAPGDGGTAIAPKSAAPDSTAVNSPAQVTTVAPSPVSAAPNPPSASATPVPASAAVPQTASSDASGPDASPVPAVANAPASTVTPPPPAVAASPDTTVPPQTSTPTPAASVTPPAAPAPTPAVSVTPPAAPPPTIADQIADQLRQLTSGKFDRLVGGKAERASIESFYAGRSYAPLWISDGHVNDRALAAIGYLAHVGADGLDPADYPVPDFKSLTDPQALAEAELKFDASVVTFAHHASIGRVAWSRVDANIEYDTKAPDAASVLASMADTKDVAAALDAYEPHAAGYLALKAKLAEIRGGKKEALTPPISGGPALRIGQKDSRVPALRERLGVAGSGDVYDKALAEAVKGFQKEHELRQTGTLTEATREALNGPKPTHVVETILANMERWRWMPHDLGKAYVMINLPDFTASVYKDGKRIWKTKIVIGKPDMPTPIMTKMMKFITVNPIWHVPPSIINREYLPAMAQDPTVMQRMGLVVERNNAGKVIGIYQPPGDKNAEGRLRFNFPNKFLVYQHDTPDKYMFAYAKRAFSHGCMRTQDPAKYAEVLLSIARPNDGYTEERIKRMYGPNEINIEFPTFIPIHVTYQTAFVDQQGKLELRDDIYGRDRELLAILNNSQEMRIADIPVEHQISAVHREILNTADNIPTAAHGWGGSGGWNGPSGGPVGFFQQLFGGFNPPPPPPRAVNRRRMSRTYPRHHYSAE